MNTTPEDTPQTSIPYGDGAARNVQRRGSVLPLTIIFGRIRCLILPLCLAPPAVASLQANAPAGKWNDAGAAHRIGNGYTPGIATDAAGTIHLVYMHEGAIFYRQGRAGGEFGPPEEIPSPEGKANYNSPHVACGAGGVVHVVFERDATKASRKAWYSSRRGGQWQPPLLAIERTEPERRVNYPRLTLDGNAAWLGAFAAGGSTIVRLVDLDTKPRVNGRIDTKLWVAHAFPRDGELLVIGRAGASGHKLERYDAALRMKGEPLLLSRGTPTKSFECTAAIMDPAGVIHVVGSTGQPGHRLWYATDARAVKGEPVILGPEFGLKPGEYTYPVMARDTHGRIYVSYRDDTTGEARLTIVDERNGFADPVTVSPTVTRRMRWNPQVAAAVGGGVHVVWDFNNEMFIRTVGAAPVRR